MRLDRLIACKVCRPCLIAAGAVSLGVFTVSPQRLGAEAYTDTTPPQTAQESSPVAPRSSGIASTGTGPEVDTSGSSEARVLFETARVMLQKGDTRQALDTFHRAVEKDPNFAQGWMAVGNLHVSLHDVADGLDEIKRAIALDPKNPEYYKTLAITLGLTGRIEEALDAWIRLRQIAPEDRDAPKQIVTILISMGKFAEAIPDLELLTSSPDGRPLLLQLAVAYLRVGQKDKAVATFEQAARLDPSVASLNTVAYVMTEEHLALDVALRYGEEAVRAQESETAGISLQRLTYEDVRGMAELGGDWDTVGWTHFAMNHLEQAERYLKAAWSLYESPTIGDHLAQIYEKEGKRQDAIQTFARVIAQGNAPEESIERLTALEGDASLAQRDVEAAGANFIRLHSISVNYHVDAVSRAEFFLLFRKGAGVVDVKFISGSESLRDAVSAIRNAGFELLFPDNAVTQILRRGILACSPGSSHCELILMPPDAVQSVQ